MLNAFFIAGTDTDVGKTVASKAILQSLNDRGLSTIGYKPIAAGCEFTADGNKRNSDALHLQEASSLSVEYHDVNPFAMTLPASPHIAAKHDNMGVDFAVLSEKLTQHKANADVVLIEGAGGWRVPVSDTDCLSAWVQKEKLPVVLVVGIKLGCLSHAMLTAEVIKHDGLELAGWVANRVNPGIEHYGEIIKMLEDKLKVPKLGEIPYIPRPTVKNLSKYIDVSPLIG